MALSFSVADLQRVQASQYVSAVGLVILLWDHILTFSDEVQYIWKAKLSLPKVLFLFNRYMVPFAMIVQTHEFSGIAPYLSVTVRMFHFVLCAWLINDRIAVWYALAVAVGMLSIATSNFLILLRLWVLWDRSPRLMLGTLTFFVATQLVALSLAGYVIHEMLPTLFFDSFLRVCVPTSKPRFLLLWAPGIAFEFMIFLTTVWNALDRPRSRSIKMAKIMYRDGCVYFFGLFALRLLNMLLSIIAPISLTFLGVFFIWSVSNITLSRLILNLRREACRVFPRRKMQVEKEVEDDVEDDINCTELPVLRGQYSEECDFEPTHKVVL